MCIAIEAMANAVLMVSEGPKKQCIIIGIIKNISVILIKKNNKTRNYSLAINSICNTAALFAIDMTYIILVKHRVQLEYIYV